MTNQSVSEKATNLRHFRALSIHEKHDMRHSSNFSLLNNFFFTSYRFHNDSLNVFLVVSPAEKWSIAAPA